MYHDTVTHSRDSPTTTILRTSVSPIIHIYGNLYIYIYNYWQVLYAFYQIVESFEMLGHNVYCLHQLFRKILNL